MLKFPPVPLPCDCASVCKRTGTRTQAFLREHLGLCYIRQQGLTISPSFQIGGLTMPRKRKSVESTEIPIATIAPSEPSSATAASPRNRQQCSIRMPSARAARGPPFRRKWTPLPDPFGIARDNLAGVRSLESKQDRQMAIKFEDKPSQAVIDKIKEAGFRWKPEHRIWANPVYPESAMSTRIAAETLYQEVCKMIRQEKWGSKQGKSVPF